MAQSSKVNFRNLEKMVISYQLKLVKMRAELANLNHCVVHFLSRAAVNLCWYYYNNKTFILDSWPHIVIAIQIDARPSSHKLML